MWLFAIIVAIPLIEIALFVEIGGWLTLWPTLAIVIGTGVLGTWLVRRQGVAVLRDLTMALREMRDPVAPLAHGGMILFAGALLLTPGFFTDAVGFLLLVPAIRERAIRAVAARIAAKGGPDRRRPASGPVVIEGEYVDVSREGGRNGAREPSGWTKH